MRSVDEGSPPSTKAATTLGFGFMDKEELGERLVQSVAEEIRRVSMKEQFTTTVSEREGRRQSIAPLPTRS